MSSASIHLLRGSDKKMVIQRGSDLNNRTEVLPSEYINDSRIKDYLTKVRNPDLLHRDDVILGRDDKRLLVDIVHRLQRLCKEIGYGNFAVLGFDDALRFAGNNRAVGAFTKSELEFLEMIFYRNAQDYGFMGDKQIVDLHQEIKKSDIQKVPHSGNYLFKGESFGKYEKLKGEMGDELLLTSGIRGLVKQFYLFLYKAFRHEANLSLASRSLAPPGYSYHATGDFDIGQRGLGAYNFSERFTTTPVFKQLAEQGYVTCRYQRDNMLGVRYEPWHIKLY